MSRKKKKKSFNHNPFRDLKGFSVSTPEKNRESASPKEPPPSPDDETDFAAEMARLGVKRSGADSDIDSEKKKVGEEREGQDTAGPAPPVSEEELFLAALSGLDVRFEDGLPGPEEGAETRAVPRRMKQLRQGRLAPEEELDLHGLSRAEVATRVGHFLDNAVYHGRRTVLVITGRGLGSGGEPVLRREVERFLEGEGRRWASEWGRAPRRHGGEGALVVFLKTPKGMK